MHDHNGDCIIGAAGSYNGRGRLKPESICARGVQTDNLHLITGAQESRSSSIFTCLVNGVITRSATRIEVVFQCPVVGLRNIHGMSRINEIVFIVFANGCDT